MKSKYLLLCLSMLLLSTQTQVYGQLYIADKFSTLATTDMYVPGDVIIAPTGTILHNGSITFTGDLTNQGNSMYAPGNPPIATSGSWTLVGTIVQNIDFGADTLANIILDNSNGIVGANMAIGGTVIFTNGQWLFAATDARLLSSATVTGANASNYFVTDGAGQLYRDYDVAGLKVYPIGTAIMYAPLELNPQAANKVGARVTTPFYENPETQTNVVTENAVALTWVIMPEALISAGDIGLSYPSTAELTNFTRADANIVSWEDGSSTSYLSQNATTTGTDPYSTELAAAFEADAAGIYYLGITDDESDQNNVLLAVSCFLEGAFNGTTMNNDLGTGGATSILANYALNQPYNTAPWNYAGSESITEQFLIDNTDIVDWILIELRDANDPSIIVTQLAALLRADGTIIDHLGEATAIITAAPGSYIVAIRHRNHGDVRSLSAIDLSVTNGSFDIRTSNANVLGSTNLKQVGPAYVMYSGDADGNNDINAVDNNSYWRLNSGTTNTYNLSDFDMNGDVNSIDINLHWRINTGTIISFN